MKKKSYLKLNFIAFILVIFSNFFIFTLLLECTKDFPINKNNECVQYCNKEQFDSGECEVTFPLLKIKWLNNIITFENTRGDIYLALDYSGEANKLIFATTLSNNKERIYYGTEYGNNYFIKNNKDSSQYIPYVKKSISQDENSDMTYADIILMSFNYNYIIFIGNKNNYIEIINLELETDYMNTFPLTSFLNETRIIQGVSSFSYVFYSNNLIYVSITTKEDNPSYFYLSFFIFLFIPQERTLLPILQSFNDFDVIKGEYFNCLYSPLGISYISCIYLNKENAYSITLFKKNSNDFINHTSIIIGYPEVNNNKYYFLKGILINKFYNIYVYYSGKDNNIPTFIFKELDQNYEFLDKFSNIPALYLTDYNFNSDIRYNDLIKKSLNEIFFISTNKEKEILIIAEIKIFTPTSNGDKQISIRYFNIEFKKYYNMKILNGLKGVYFKNFFLTLAVDYCVSDSCSNYNEKKGNSALIPLSYCYKLNNKINIDFIEYAFNNNTNYVILDLKEDVKIENNIFGMYLLQINLEEEEDWLFDSGINYYIVNTGKSLKETFSFKAEDSFINVSFSDYSYDKIIVKMAFSYIFKTPNNTTEYNLYLDKYNDTLGDINDEKSYEALTYYSKNYQYYININENLSTNCNDTNCNLCLRNDTDYCIICNNKYNIIYHKTFINGKKKICNKDYINEELLDFFNGKYNDTILSNEEIKKPYVQIKDFLLNNYDGNNTIIKTGNVKIQISNVDAQKYTKELSNIDLGECGEILNQKYCKSKNDSLVIMKFDITPENEKSTYVQYEVYDPNSKTFLNLNECIGSNIKINIPIDLDSDLELLYDLLSNSGYNLFDSNDSFYNDICSTFSTQNGTDILLYDRRMDIYQSTVNISLCQEECEFQSYNSETKKAECNCPIQNEEMNLELSDVEFDKNKMIEQFYETLENSNFRVLKCYKLVFNFKLYIKNIGSIIMTILIVLFIILIIINIFISPKKINMLIQSIIKNKYLENINELSKSKFNQPNEEINIYNKKNFKNNDVFNLNYNNKIKVNNNEKLSEVYNSPKSKKIKRKKRKRFTFNKDSNRNFKNLGNENVKNSKDKLYSTNNYLKYNTDVKFMPPKRKHKKLNSEKVNSNIVFRNYIKNNTNINQIPQNYLCFNLIENKSNNFNKNVKENNNKIKKKKIKKNNIEVFPEKITLREPLKKKRKKSHNKTDINSPKKQKHLVLRKKTNKNTLILRNRIDSKDLKEKNTDKSNINIKNKEVQIEEIETLNDEEMNTLEYKKALLLDKRTYFQFYLSLIKKKQLIIFTFFPTNDYNLMSLKISLFLVSFSLYLAVNGFFFNDDTMHKIYVDNGAYNIIYQIPKILYSSVVSISINMILKLLSLSEKNILKLKQEKNMRNGVYISKNIKKCINIKFTLFFLLSLLLMSFFWYFISCFCAVYNNTQIILFKDTLLSFGLSMIYPFGINLLPGFFRIPSLRAEKKDKKCLYSFSLLLALL